MDEQEEVESLEVEAEEQIGADDSNIRVASEADVKSNILSIKSKIGSVHSTEIAGEEREVEDEQVETEEKEEEDHEEEGEEEEEEEKEVIDQEELDEMSEHSSEDESHEELEEYEKELEDEMAEITMGEIEGEYWEMDESEEEEEQPRRRTTKRDRVEKPSLRKDAISLRRSEDDDLDKVFGEAYPGIGLGSLVSFTSYQEEGDSFSEEEQTPHDVNADLLKGGVKREDYLEEYNKLILERNALRRKNGYLQKKMSEYYLKRKIISVFEEMNTAALAEVIPKYTSKMSELYDLEMFARQNRDTLKGELDFMKDAREKLQVALEKNYEDLLKREKDAGTGLVFTKTGKVLSDKVVDRLIQRKRQKSKAITDMRIKYIKERNKNHLKENQLKRVENFGGDLNIMQYEQREIEFQNQSDKLEEREEELTRLRHKFAHSTHALAHIREKMSHAKSEIERLIEQNAEIMDEFKFYRETVTEWRSQRDKNRAETQMLLRKSGLLTYKLMLKDMEVDFEEFRKESELLANLQAEHAKLEEKNFAIEKHIELQKQKLGKETPELTTKNSSSSKPVIVLPRVS